MKHKRKRLALTRNEDSVPMSREQRKNE